MATQVLYITYDGLTDPLGQSQILPYLQQLAKEGYRFTILSFEKRQRFEQEGGMVQALTAASGIEWVPLFFTARPPVLSKMYDRWRMKRKAVSLHRQKKFSLTHCRSYVAAEVGLFLKQQFGVKMLFDMRGFWADEKVDNGQWDIEKVLYKRIYQFYKKKERQFLLSADGIVSLTHAAKTYLLQQPEYSHLQIDVIPCCADLSHFNYNNVAPSASGDLKKLLGISETTKILTYLGSVGGWYMTAEMFRFFKLLHQQQPEYRMLILTKDDPEQVRQEAVTAGLAPASVLIRYAPRQVLPVYLALSTCSIFFIRNTFSKMASSPTKHAELMGMGIPVICNDIGDTGYIINETKTGMVVNEFDTGTLEKAVAALEAVTQINRDHIRRNAIELFDLNTGVKKYSSLYHRILHAGSVVA